MLSICPTCDREVYPYATNTLKGIILHFYKCTCGCQFYEEEINNNNIKEKI